MLGAGVDCLGATDGLVYCRAGLLGGDESWGLGEGVGRELDRGEAQTEGCRAAEGAETDGTAEGVDRIVGGVEIDGVGETERLSILPGDSTFLGDAIDGTLLREEGVAA